MQICVILRYVTKVEMLYQEKKEQIKKEFLNTASILIQNKILSVHYQ